jgi:hypothetical protein
VRAHPIVLAVVLALGCQQADRPLEVSDTTERAPKEPGAAGEVAPARSSDPQAAELDPGVTSRASDSPRPARRIHASNRIARVSTTPRPAGAPHTPVSMPGATARAARPAPAPVGTTSAIATVPAAPELYEPAESVYVNPFGPRGPAPAMRIGRGIDPDGRVPDAEQTDVLMPSEPVYISVRMPPALDGATGRLSIYEGSSGDLVWVDDAFASGGDFVSFEIAPRALAPADYVALLVVGGQQIADHRFAISE